MIGSRPWFGGDKEGWERGPYYADGLVPLAYLLDDDRLKAKAQEWVETFLAGQDESGWIGPVQGVLGDRKYPEYDPGRCSLFSRCLLSIMKPPVTTVAIGDAEFLPYGRHLEERPLESWAKFAGRTLSSAFSGYMNEPRGLAARLGRRKSVSKGMIGRSLHQLPLQEKADDDQLRVMW